MKKIFNRIINCQGHSILELIIALAIFSLIIASLTGLILGSFQSFQRGSELNKANALAQEGTEAVRAIGNRAFNEFEYSRSAVSTSGSQWILTGEGTTEQINSFTRQIDFIDVYRNSDGSLSTSTNPNAYLDVMSKKVNTTISWEIRDGINNSIVRTVYLTNWAANIWEQTNWIGARGQTSWTDETKYDSDDGNIEISIVGQFSLIEVATSTYSAEGYLISSAFDTGDQSAFSTITWDSELPEECSLCEIKIQIKTASDSGGAPGDWSNTWSGPEGEDGDEDDFFATSTGQIIHIDHNDDQWVKYKVLLIGDASSTPILKEIKAYYQL